MPKASIAGARAGGALRFGGMKFVHMGFMGTLFPICPCLLYTSIPSLYSALGIYLPLITTNCAVLGVVLLNTQYSFGFVQSVVYGVFGGLGFMLAICLFASVRETVSYTHLDVYKRQMYMSGQM